MLKRAMNSKRSIFQKSSLILSLLLIALGASSCDRGAGAQVAAARQFTDAVVVNDVARRDSMIATMRLKEHFENDYTTAEIINWFRSFYDLGQKKFKTLSRADVDAKLTETIEGGLLKPGEIEETGMVRVNSAIEGEQHAYFWMVKQKDQPWKIAMVTKGEMKVLFK